MGKVSGAPVFCTAGILGLALGFALRVTACVCGELESILENAAELSAVSEAHAGNADGGIPAIALQQHRALASMAAGLSSSNCTR